MNISKSFFNKTSFEKIEEDKLYYEEESELARNILKIIMNFRRTPTSVTICELSCPLCSFPHLKKIITALKREKPVTFVLPAFPGKSPNRDKVLGTLPDMAERRALCFLQELCDKINSIYSPGAHITLCSDGRVFSDIVGMREKDVTDYQHELDQMIKELSLKNISTFNLDALFNGNDFDQMRQDLMERFGKSLESLKEKRNFLGSEIDKSYYSVLTKRITNEQSQTSLF